jgi:1-acyl-sn-glycerol-3-phosphate acyltransferase
MSAAKREKVSVKGALYLILIDLSPFSNVTRATKVGQVSDWPSLQKLLELRGGKSVILQSIVFGLVFWLTVLTSLWALVPYHLLKILGFRRQAWFFLGRLGRFYSKFILKALAGCQIHVEGLENIPQGKPYCFISNHQAYADILLLMATVPQAAGYIAKRSLRYAPVIRTWMQELGCYFLKRDSLKDGLKGILYGVDRVKRGFPMVLFPEGTRSKGPEMNEFKKGGLKLATKAKAWAVPVSIQGTYRVLEQTGKVRPSWIAIRFHPPVDTTKLSSVEENSLTDDLWNKIHEGVLELQKKSPQAVK